MLVIGALRSVVSSRALFFPQDRDRLAPTTTLQYTLARPMTVTWTLRDAAGRIVITRLSEVAQAAGTYSWVFDGRRPDGSMLPRGRYVSHVVATDGVLLAAQAVGFEADAFTMKTSDSTPGRGQKITVTVVSAEGLSRSPRLHIYQPRISRWSVAMTKIAKGTYRVTFRLKSYGRTGNVSFKVVGFDTNGAKQSTTKVYPLH